MTRNTILFTLLAAAAAATPAVAQVAPEIGYVYPPGGKAGSTVAVHLGGAEWTPDMQFFVHDKRVKLEVLGPPGELLIPPPPYWFGAKGRLQSMPLLRERPARFVIPADIPPGPIRWQAANANGATSAGIFIVGTGDELVEDEKRETGQVLPTLPVTMSGRLLKNEEVDRYTFTAAKTGPVTCELTARRLGSNFNGVLEVFDANGRLVAEAVDTEGNDPVLTFAATAGVAYTISVHDIDHAGDRSFTYRLAVAPGPRVLAALPAVGKRGEVREVEFILSSGTSKPESLKKTVTFPAGDAASFTYKLDTPSGLTTHTFPLSNLPEAVAPASQQPVPLTVPGAATGILNQPGAEARFTLTGKKGDRWSIAAYARQFGSPLDTTLKLLDPVGKPIAANDDRPGTTDAGLEFTVPADGAYQLVVGDTSGTAGSRTAVYRVSVRPPADGFTLHADAQKLHVLIGQKPSLTMKATRTGNFKGPIALTVSDLPAGVSVTPNLVIPADKNELAVPLDVTADAAVTASLVTVAGTADVSGKAVTHPALAPFAPTVGNLAPQSPEESETANFLVAMTMKPRVKGAPVDKDTGRKVPRGSTHPADVTLERLEGYAGEIVLKQSARQSYQVQGITGRDTVVPSDATKAAFPCFMPEWLETSRTSRMGIVSEVRVADPKGNVRHLVAPIEGFVTMTMEGALLKLSHTDEERTVRPGETFTVRIRLARSPRLTEPVRLEFVPPERLGITITADAVIVAPNQTEADIRVATAAGADLSKGEQVLVFRGTVLQSGNLPVVSETPILVSFRPAGR